jgi:lysophospholipase L1-like esterase
MDSYNELLRQAAGRQKIEVNDLHKAIALDIPGNIGPDCIHLSEKGIEIAASLLRAVSKIPVNRL